MSVTPFAIAGEWLRGNLHTHSTRSDGGREPADVLRWHLDHGYDFVAITDHDRRTIEAAPKGLVALAGAELSLGKGVAGSPYHLVAIGLPGDELPRSSDRPAVIRELAAMGAVAFLAHPYWSMLTPEEVLQARGCLGLEVFNHACEVENLKGLATVHWDQALTAGWRAFGFATDDSHWKIDDHGGGWIWVRARRRDPEAILEAIREGRFYASSGPRIEDFRVEGCRVSVRTSPAARIYWIGPRHHGWHAADRKGRPIAEARFDVPATLAHVRIEVVDTEGRRAWSPPHFFDRA